MHKHVQELEGGTKIGDEGASEYSLKLLGTPQDEIELALCKLAQSLCKFQHKYRRFLKKRKMHGKLTKKRGKHGSSQKLVIWDSKSKVKITASTSFAGPK